MSSTGRRRAVILFPVLFVLFALALLAACDDDKDDYFAAPTATQPATATEPAAATVEAMQTPTAPPVASEAGEEPVFWRTPDNFASIRANEGYKVVFRVTNGYAEDTLSIVAEPEGGEALEIVADRTQPLGEDKPGTYYELSLELPQPGRWQLTVLAGADEVNIPVEAGPAATPVNLP